MKKLYKIFLVFAITSILVGCTNQQIYNSIQQNRKSACPNFPESAYLACIQRHSTSYEDYKKTLPSEKKNES